MTPSHHPGDEMLMDYAAGNVVEAVGMILATHLALCPRCRQQVADYEAVGGALLDELPPAAVAPDALAALLARLDEPEAPAAEPPHASPHRTPDSVTEASLLPEPLRSYLGAGPAGLRWRTLMPGIEMVPVPFAPGNPTTRLLRVGGGVAVPRHTHPGQELTLVLTGGYRDATGRYGRGDFTACDRSIDHRPVADPDGACLCLVVADGPVRLTGTVGRLLNPFVRF